MAASWLLLIGAVTTGPVWIPWTYPTPEAHTLPHLSYAPLSALVPLILGVMVGAWGWRYLRRTNWPTRLRIPPGDVLQWIEPQLLRAWSVRKLPGRDRPAVPGPGFGVVAVLLTLALAWGFLM